MIAHVEGKIVEKFAGSLIIDVHGVGYEVQVRNAIANSDSAYITKASGVGKKSAERVVVDLSDKVGLPTHYGAAQPIQTEINVNDEALEALMALGYTLADATAALDGVDPKLPTNRRVTEALKAGK